MIGVDAWSMHMGGKNGVCGVNALAHLEEELGGQRQGDSGWDIELVVDGGKNIRWQRVDVLLCEIIPCSSKRNLSSLEEADMDHFLLPVLLLSTENILLELNLTSPAPSVWLSVSALATI